LVSDLGGGVLLAVGGDLRQVDDLEKAIATAFLWTIGLAAILGIIGGALLSRAFLRRVDAISRTAEAIIDGDLTRRVPTRGTGDDLDRLASTLNHMLDRIGILMESLPGKQRRGPRPANSFDPALSAAGRRAGACAVEGRLRVRDRRRDRRGREIARHFFRFAADRAG
jgi:HAMP domain-containing protein